MATFLEGVGFLSEFSIIFPFILILVVVYALAQYTKMLGDNKGVHAIVALAVAALFLFSGAANEIVKVITPWFVVLFIFILFLMTGMKMVGGPDIDFKSVMGTHQSIVYWIIALALVITLGAIANVFSNPGEPFGDGEVTAAGGVGGSTISSGSGEPPGGFSSKYAAEKGEFWGTIVHPKVLGMVVLLMIGSFTIRYMASSS